MHYVFNLQELVYEDQYYHEQCFRCTRCDRSLADEPFTCQDEVLLCNDCYCSEFSSKCVACDKTIMPGMVDILEYILVDILVLLLKVNRLISRELQKSSVSLMDVFQQEQHDKLGCWISS